jgi:hypothetical protein
MPAGHRILHIPSSNDYNQGRRMRNLSALALVLWVLCLAGVEVHPCCCDDSECSSHSRSAPCGRSRGCHHDGCPSDVCRLEQDEWVASGQLVDAVQHAWAALLDLSAIGPATRPIESGCVEALQNLTPLPSLEASVGAALPLLI